MPSRRYRLLTLAMAALAIVAFFALPPFAAQVVRGALVRSGAADRAAYARGDSPWSWRFRSDDDLVADRVFGNATLTTTDDGVVITPVGDGHGELGFPLTRQADLRRLNRLRVDASVASGAFALVVRPTLTAPQVQADIASLDAPIALSRLAWRDVSGHAVPAPARAAMLRLAFTLPAGSRLVLRGAGLSRADRPSPTSGTALPHGMTAEGLLRWRDRQREIDPLVTFGDAPPETPGSSWVPWIAPGLYAIALLVGGLTTRRRSSTPTDVLNAALVLMGPLWLIAGLGLGAPPEPSAMAMFAGGVVYGLFLTLTRALPRWHWRGGWRFSGWPLLAIPVAIGLIAVAGHAPTWPPLGHVLLYIGWAFFQQWLMLAVVGGLLARALPRPAAVLIVALAFALLHTPNGLLMQLCFVAELAWAWWYLHQRALLPVAVAHAACAVILQACMAGGILRSLEVSARFLS